MAVVATLAASPIPAADSLGSVLGTMFKHVTVTSAGGAGTYLFAHGLPWTPTAVIIIPQLAEATAPSAANSAVAWCYADTDATNIGINLPGNATYHVIYT